MTALWLSLAVVVFILTPGESFPDQRGRFEAAFNADDELIRPAGWREWIFVGNLLTRKNQNDGNTAVQEFHTVYIDPDSWEFWKRTGSFREGAMLAMELTVAANKTASTGNGLFSGKIKKLEIAHKDSSRYPQSTSGWAYYSFSHKSKSYADAATVMPIAVCAACHAAAAADEMVFTQYYPILVAAKDAGERE